MDRQRETFLTNYTGRRPTPLSGCERFLGAIRDGNLELVSRNASIFSDISFAETPKQTAKKIFSEKKKLHNIDPNSSMPSLPSGESGIHIAAREGHLDCIEFLLEQGADINLAEKRRKTAMHMAAGAGHLEVVKLLIKNKASLDLIDKFGRTPLMWAASAGHIDVVKELLGAGASLKSGQGNWHPLHEACKHGFLDIAKILINAGSPVNNPSEFKGCTPWSPLHIATREGHLDCINMLIDAGADVHSKNAGGHTSLHEASYRGYSDIVRRLLQHNANPNSQNNQKRTPLHEACSQGKLPCLVLLLDAGSKPNAQDMIFDTPLHHVLRARHPPPTAMALMSILLQYGASPSIMGSSDQTPFDIINDTGQSECSDVLMEALENPLTLMQMCKVTIRRKLKIDLDKVNSLPLPLSVKTFIKDDIDMDREGGTIVGELIMFT